MIEFYERVPGLSIVSISNTAGRAEVSLYGGQVLSFIPLGQSEILFFSDTSVFKDGVFKRGKALRGGIPVCWPWFGPHHENATLADHGFSRLMQWEFLSLSEEENESTIILGCTSSPETIALWNYTFNLELAVTMGRTLSLQLTTTNTGTEDFFITDAFHSYFRVADITTIQVLGLEGSSYRDDVDSSISKEQTGSIRIESETDRVYHSSAPCVISDPGNKRSITIKKKGFPETIVWNPWIDRSKNLSHFGENEYQNMICVESGSVLHPVLVKALSSITQEMKITVTSNDEQKNKTAKSRSEVKLI